MDNYTEFGDEWKAEMMKWPKKHLIDQLAKRAKLALRRLCDRLASMEVEAGLCGLFSNIQFKIMTPSQMFQNHGIDEKTPFQKGDKVNTPIGLAEFISQFTRGLKWWCETSTGTFSAETINSLNEQKCDNCGKAGGVIPAPDQYEGWCRDCARSDAMADSDAYDYRTEQIEGNGW